jgi:hypothetical protein
MLALCGAGLFSGVQAEDLCRVLARPKDFAGKSLTIRAAVRPTMHGTYLHQPGCADSILAVLPEEIPGYRGSVRLVKDSEFDKFLDARFDHRPGAPSFEAVFLGQLEYSPRVRFGYYKNHRTRFVLQAVRSAATSE